MAKESFDKEIQFLRLLVLTSGAYSRQQFAQRLGISVHTFDKTLRRLKEIVTTLYRRLPADEGRELADAVRYSYYDSAEPMLLFLFRAKSVKDSESERLPLLMSALQEQPRTAMELIDLLSGVLPEDAPLPDEKTIRSDLKYLEEIGVVTKLKGPRPNRYRLQDDLVRSLTDEELLELYDYVDVMANIQVPSVQGYILRDGLKRAVQHRHANTSLSLEPFLYKYHYHSRLLDEAHLFALLHAIRHRCRIRFLYFSPKSQTSYTSRNTNPLFERESKGRLETTIPLHIVYDHQYGRWYLLASGREGIRKYRMEGMMQLEELDVVDEEWFQAKKAALLDKLRTSWLLDTGNTVMVRARFYKPESGTANFILDRVLQQGQWGQIVEEEEDSFIYEIQVNGTTEIKPWLRSFGSSCEVLAPRGLRQEMIEEWKELQAYYEPLRENL